MNRFLAVVLMSAALTASGSNRAPACVTLVADLNGTVMVADRVSAKPEDRWPVELLQCFLAGKVLMLEAGARATLFYPGTGEAVALSGPGSFEIGSDTVRPTSTASVPSRIPLNAAFRDIKLDRSRLAPAGVRMRDPRIAGGLLPLEPRGVVLAEDALVFRWGPVEGARDYRFRLADMRRDVVFEGRTPAAEVTLPSDIRLAAGERLMWQVDAVLSSGQKRSRWQEFVIATPEARALAARIDHELASPSAAERNLREVLLLQNMGPDKLEP